MAFYTDYTTIVPFVYNGSVTNSAVCNVIADTLVQYADYTLVKRATENSFSSTTNYAEVEYHGVFARFYADTTALGEITCVLAYSSGGTAKRTTTYSGFAYVANTSVTVNLRVYNLKTGKLVYFRSRDTLWYTLLYNTPVTQLNTSVIRYACAVSTGVGGGANLGLAINDSANTVFTLGGAGFWDSEGLIQMLSPVHAQDTIGVRYLLQGVYYSIHYIYTGIVQLGAQYFLITTDSSYPTALELNP